jgi:4-amino-4-deoxy-L-arabinose transferase-like glycosyltransferase
VPAARAHLPALLILAVPYLVAIAALDGLTEQLQIFHGTDEETYHLPTIRQFAEQWPAPDLVSYPAAQTPLFHLLLAAAGKVVGFELWRLRLLDVIIAYAAAIAAYRLLDRRGLGRTSALLLAALLALSPYVFGSSFLVFTDGLGLLLALLAIDAFDRLRSSGRLRTAAWGAAAIGAALLTRQSYVWLCPLAGLLVLAAPGTVLDRRGKAMALALIALATVPLWALVIAWGGPVPPNGDPASCGICDSERGGIVGLRPPLFTLGILGLYGSVLLGPALWAERRELARGAIAGAIVAAVAIRLQPLRVGEGDEGYLWNAAGRAPELLGSSALLLALVPLGGAVLGALAARRGGDRVLPLGLAICFLAFSVLTGLAYQKYYDPFALLVLLLAARPEDFAGTRPRLAVGALAVGFVIYVFSVPPPTPRVAHSALEPIDQSVTMKAWPQRRRTPPTPLMSSPRRSPKPPVRPSGRSPRSASSSFWATSSST